MRDAADRLSDRRTASPRLERGVAGLRHGVADQEPGRVGAWRKIELRGGDLVLTAGDEVGRRRDRDRTRKVVHLPLGPEGPEARRATAIGRGAAEGHVDVPLEVAVDRLGLPGCWIGDRASGSQARRTRGYGHGG